MQLTLPDGRVIVSGGYYSLSGPPNTWTEIVDTRVTPFAISAAVDPFLDAIAWDNLYPSMYMLPIADPARPGTHFILKYSCAQGWITTINPDNTWGKVRGGQMGWGCEGHPMRTVLRSPQRGEEG